MALGDLEHLLHIRQIDGYDERDTTNAIGWIKMRVLHLLVDVQGLRSPSDMLGEAKRNIHVGRSYVEQMIHQGIERPDWETLSDTDYQQNP